MDVVDALKNYFYYKEYPLDSPEYELALSIDLIIQNLLKDQVIDKTDVEILNYFLQGFSIRKIANMLNLDRKSVSKRFKRSLVFIGLRNDEP